MAKKNKLSSEELLKLRKEREEKAKREMPWIFVRLVLAIVLITIYFINKYQIDKIYQIFDITKNTKVIWLVIIMIIAFIASILKCAKIELEDKNLSITSKTIREEKESLKLENKTVRFVGFAKSKSWLILLLAIGILTPSVIGITIYAASLVLMLIFAYNKKFKQMDFTLNIVILGMLSVLARVILI